MQFQLQINANSSTSEEKKDIPTRSLEVIKSELYFIWSKDFFYVLLRYRD